MLILIVVIQMGGVYKNLQLYPYDELYGKLDQITLKKANFIYNPNAGNMKIPNHIDIDTDIDINKTKIKNNTKINYPTFSYVINVLNNIRVEYIPNRIYPVNEINVFIKKNIYFTDIDLLEYYKNGAVEFIYDKNHIFYDQNKSARNIIQNYKIINIFDILLNNNNYNPFLVKFIANFIMNITQLDFILILSKNDIYKVQICNYNDYSLKNDGLEFICNINKQTIIFNNEYIYYDNNNNNNNNNDNDYMLNLYVKRIINNSTNICLSKSKYTYKLLYFDFNPFIYFSESFYNFDAKNTKEERFFTNEDVFNKKYQVYELNINMDHIMINSRNLLIISLLYNNSFLLNNIDKTIYSNNSKYHMIADRAYMEALKNKTKLNYQILPYNYDLFFDEKHCILKNNYFYFIIQNKFLQERHVWKSEYKYDFLLYKHFCKILFGKNIVLQKYTEIDDVFIKMYIDFQKEQYVNYDEDLDFLKKSNKQKTDLLKLHIDNFIYPTVWYLTNTWTRNHITNMIDTSHNKNLNKIIQYSSIQNEILNDTKIHASLNEQFKIKNSCYVQKNSSSKNFINNDNNNNNMFIDKVLKPNKKSYYLYQSFTKYNTARSIIYNKEEIMVNINMIRLKLSKHMESQINKYGYKRYEINYLFTTLYNKKLINIEHTYKNFKISQKYKAIIEYIFCKLIFNSINIIYDKLDSLDKNSDMYICQIINRNQLTFLNKDLLLNFENIEKVNLLFQYSCGYFVRESQIKIIEKIKDCLDNNYSHIIQLVMGEGKSTFIIPYICFESVLKNNRNCIILIPNNEKLLVDMNNNLTKIQSIFNIKIESYSNFDEYNYGLNTNIDIHLMSYNAFKELYYYATKNSSHNNFINIIKKYFIQIDEIDLFLKPNICEMNVVDKEIVYPNKQKLIELFSFIRTKMGNNTNILRDCFLSNTNKISINKELASSKFIEFSEYVYNKDYGTNFIIGKNFYLSKPYNYVNNPDLESEFSDFFIKIYTTYVSYYKHA